MANIRVAKSQEPLIASEHERARLKEQRKEEQRKRQGDSLEEARLYIIQDNPTQAVEVAFRTLQSSATVFGENSIELMPIYFLLADANLKLGRQKKAEEFLVSAKWNLLKHQPSSTEAAAEGGSEGAVPQTVLSNLQSRLHKSFGTLFTELGRYDEALKEITENIYLESLAKGPEHYSLCKSYFIIGRIFQLKERMLQAEACFMQVPMIWRKYLDAPEELSRINVVEMEESKSDFQHILEFQTAQNNGEETEETIFVSKVFSDLEDAIIAKRDKRRLSEDYEGSDIL